MKILITGASGLVATELSLLLLSNTSHALTLLSRDSDKIKQRYSSYGERVVCSSLDKEINSEIAPHYDVVIHTAFARSASSEDIADSLIFQDKLCHWLKQGHVNKFINISSQSVYGNDYQPGTDESGVCKPDYLYALGKFSSEIISSASFDVSDTVVFNLRLASVCENARFMKIFIENYLKGEQIELVAPEQTVSFIDVRDVAHALLCVIENNTSNGGIFNVGTGSWYTIRTVTEIINKIGSEYYHLPPIKINLCDNGTRKTIGMDVQRFEDTFSWHPKYTINDMVVSLFEMLKNVNGGGYPASFRLVYNL